jgi:hypothetical protein
MQTSTTISRLIQLHGSQVAQRTLLRINLRPIALALMLTFSLVPIASAADCLDAATKALEARGIADWDRSKSPMLQQIVSGQAIVVGYGAWFRVDRCPNGYVIVNMRTTCTVSDIWTQGSCEPELQRALEESP